jgi:hypothetical protein
LDLIRWGARFKANSSRPYFEGHERPDVKLQREEFFNYILDRKNSYFIVSDADQPMWELPTQQPNSILICMCLKHFDFGKDIGTQCKVDTLEYLENGKSKMLHCRFPSGVNQGKTKGLLEIAKELKIKLPVKINLDNLRSLMADHPAFKTVRNCYFSNTLR